MSTDVIIGFVNGAAQVLLAVLGINLTKQKWQKAIIGVIAFVGIVLTGLQASRNHDGQVQLQAALETIRTRVETIKTDNDRPINIGPINVPSPSTSQNPTQVNVLFDCSLAFMPMTLKPGDSIYFVLLDARRNLGFGPMNIGGTTEQKWGAEYVLRYPCRLVNYSANALLSVELQPRFRYRKSTLSKEGFDTLPLDAETVSDYEDTFRIPDVPPGKEFDLSFSNPTEFWTEIYFPKTLKTANGEVAVVLQDGTMRGGVLTIGPFHPLKKSQ